MTSNHDSICQRCGLEYFSGGGLARHVDGPCDPATKTPLAAALDAAREISACGCGDGHGLAAQINNELQVILSALELVKFSDKNTIDDVGDAFFAIDVIKTLTDALAGKGAAK